MMQVWLNASEAAGLLNVRPQTLYAYVSRGLVKSEVVPGSRSKRYRRSDIERLLRRQGMTRNPRSAAKASLNWHGMPVLKSSLTLIRDGKLYYRGQDAVILAEHSSLEAVAANLWGCEIAGLLKAGVPELDAPALRTLRCADNSDQGLSTQHCLNAFQTLVGQRGGSLLALGGPVAQGAQLLRWVRATTTFLVCPKQVARHGGATAAIEDAWAHWMSLPDRTQVQRREFFESIVAATNPTAAISFTPIGLGFGHPLYPNGDPRARALLAYLPPDRVRDRLIGEVFEATGLQPSLDFVLVAVRRQFGLPEGAAFALFAIGRVVGWIAHIIEQRKYGGVIRPRAEYVGPLPELDSKLF